MGSILAAAGPIVLILAAVCAALRPGRRPAGIPALAEAASLVVLGLMLAAAGTLLWSGPSAIAWGSSPLAVTLQLDGLTTPILVLVAFIGWVVTRYSRRYLDGEAREGAFHAGMLATLALVLILAQAGSLAVLVAGFVAVGLGLRWLLLFYPGRPAARRAAAKFSLVWHGGDLALAGAAVLLAWTAGTTQLAELAAHDWTGTPTVQLAAALLVLAAALKTAAFPLHGWLTEVMEAPTPVSALLHAGIVNAGGLLLIRLAFVMQASPGAMAALVLLGGVTALFGAVVMLTQSAAKTALAWSTVAQMGFLLMQCGLGLWSLALLHVLAHSLYKAHAFLSAGGAVAAVAGQRRPGPVAVPSLGAVARAFALALTLYAGMAAAFALALGPKSVPALALGAMLVFGVAYLMAQGLADAAPRALTRRTGLASIAAAAAYFSFQRGAEAVWGPLLPAAPHPGPLEWGLIVLAVASFGIVAFAQALFPVWSHHPAAAGLRVHLANGLYLNAVFDRLIGGFRRSGQI